MNTDCRKFNMQLAVGLEDAEEVLSALVTMEERTLGW
jgi:hypothetical protein